jgi:hypothetical protein
MSSRKLAKTTSVKEKEEEEEDPRFLRRWFWIFVVLLLLFLVATIVIVIIAIEENNESLPEQIDVVLYERPGQPLRLARHLTQITAIQKYMNWINHIYILSPTQTGVNDELNVTFVPFTGTLSEAFEYMPDIPGIVDHSIFLSDQTYPFRDVKKSYMFSESQPRIFNIFREQSEVIFFATYLEETMPTLVTDLVKLREPPQTWTDLVFREVTEERIILRNDINRDIFVVSTMPENAQKQFEILQSSRPLFATFHISSADPNPDTSNNILNEFLSKEFP